LGKALLESRGDVVYIIGHSTQDIAMSTSIIKLQGQASQSIVYITAHGIDRLLRHARHNILLNIGENCTAYIQGGQYKQDMTNVSEIYAGTR